MASTVELFEGFKFEIAGSVQIPTSATVSRELGLDTLPTVDLDVIRSFLDAHYGQAPEPFGGPAKPA